MLARPVDDMLTGVTGASLKSLTTEALLGHVIRRELVDAVVVEAEPAVRVALLDEGVVVAAVRAARVHEYTDELVLVVCVIDTHLFATALVSRQPLFGPALHVDAERELEVVVELDLAVVDVVVVEALQVEDERVAELFDAAALVRIHLAAVLIAVVGVVALQLVALHPRIECLFERGLVLNVERNGKEFFFALGIIGPVLVGGLDLVGEGATELVIEQLAVCGVFELRFESLTEQIEELVHVVLFAHIGRSAVEVFVALAEIGRICGHLLRLLQLHEEVLQLIEHIVLERCAVQLCFTHAQQGLAQCTHHVELLQQTVHVARRA